MVHEGENTVMTRTFSKIYGLAGLRLGYCVTSPALTEVLRLLVYPFAVSSVVQAAAIACLDGEVEKALRENVEQVVAERARVLAALESLGFDPPESQANFVWVPLPDPNDVARALEERGVIVRPLEGGVRVTIGTAEENDALLSALATVTAGEDAAARPAADEARG